MKNKKIDARLRRKKGIRKNIFGTAEKPRVSVFRSAKHIYVQAIDDETGKTLVSFSNLEKDSKNEINYGGNMKAAEIAGKIFSNRLKEKGIKKIVFDRNGYLYHGRVKALGDQIKL